MAGAKGKSGRKPLLDEELIQKIESLLDENRKNETLNALNNASGFIRHELADRIDIRHIPELTFVFDESISYGKRIETIIHKLHNEDHN
jgi:ribosome-binding factor A